MITFQYTWLLGLSLFSGLLGKYSCFEFPKYIPFILPQARGGNSEPRTQVCP